LKAVVDDLDTCRVTTARIWPASAVIAAAGVVACGSTTTRPPTKTDVSSPNTIMLAPPAGLSARERATFRAGEILVGQAGCLACHVIGGDGNNGPGPPLTHEGSRRREAAIASALTHPKAPMPSFMGFEQQYPEKFRQLVNFISMLR
jgi:menaquinol-cytochrome c reductase cytochrome b/c subunit